MRFGVSELSFYRLGRRFIWIDRGFLYDGIVYGINDPGCRKVDNERISRFYFFEYLFRSGRFNMRVYFAVFLFSLCYLVDFFLRLVQCLNLTKE